MGLHNHTVAWCSLIGPEFSLVDHPKTFLVMPCTAFKVLPTIQVKQAVLPGIDHTGNMIVCSYD